MSLKFQIADIVLGSLLAGLATFAIGAVVRPSLAVSLGAFFAAMYYFSRNPWGMDDGAELNDRIDELYDEYLP